MKTREELRLIYPKLDSKNFEKLVELHDMHHYLENDIMRKTKVFKFLTNTLKNMYSYGNEIVVLKTLCEKLVDNNEIAKIDNENNVFLNGGCYYTLPKTAISYIKHLQFEKNVIDYYIQKQKEKTETIYVDVEKLLSK